MKKVDFSGDDFSTQEGRQAAFEKLGAADPTTQKLLDAITGIMDAFEAMPESTDVRTLMSMGEELANTSKRLRAMADSLVSFARRDEIGVNVYCLGECSAYLNAAASLSKAAMRDLAMYIPRANLDSDEERSEAPTESPPAPAPEATTEAAQA